MSENIPETLITVDKLRKNSHLGKHKHFSAATRTKGYHAYYGIPVVIINVLLGSVLFANLSTDLPQSMKWGGAILALVAAGFSGMQTFFNFQKSFEAHRRIGNQYLAVARNCERLIAEYIDGLLNLNTLADEARRVNEDYNKINLDAEAFPTNDSDFQKALSIEKAKETEKKGILYERKVASG